MDILCIKSSLDTKMRSHKLCQRPLCNEGTQGMRVSCSWAFLLTALLLRCLSTVASGSMADQPKLNRWHLHWMLQVVGREGLHCLLRYGWPSWCTAPRPRGANQPKESGDFMFHPTVQKYSELRWALMKYPSRYYKCDCIVLSNSKRLRGLPSHKDEGVLQRHPIYFPCHPI